MFLREVSKVLAEHGVSVARMIQREEPAKQSATLIITTHTTNEKAISDTLEKLEKLDTVKGEPFLLRVLKGGDA